MSRIDQALRKWEQGGKDPALTSDVETVDPSTPSPLAHYPNEGIERLVPEESAVLTVDRVATDRPVEPPPIRRRPGVHHRDADMEARLVTGVSSSVSLEQYRRLAAVLHDEQIHGNLKTVMITSAVPNEGKTLTIANLALTLSGSYRRRVLVIDADLRAPSVHSLFSIPNSRGLSEALREGGRELPILEMSPGLSVLTAGRPGPTPLADLTSERMAEVIRECAASFDWVLLDTPPVGLLPDAQVLARLAGAVIFVIAAGSTPSNAVARAISEIGADSIIGTVLNRVEDGRIPEADYYGHYQSDRE
jgi:protein-tyrosine kinase